MGAAAASPSVSSPAAAAGAGAGAPDSANGGRSKGSKVGKGKGKSKKRGGSQTVVANFVPVDDRGVCNVCMDGEGYEENPMIQCGRYDVGD